MKNWIEIIEDIDKEYFRDLKNCSHAYSTDRQNPYHLEHSGNVWGHTMDVLDIAKSKYPDDEILHLACLLHDIGKPFCREENHESQRVSFFSHESFGVFKALEILNKIPEIYLKESDKIRVLELIQRHADSYKLSLKNLLKLYSREELQDIIKIRWCDTLGREKFDDDGSDIQQILDLESKLEMFELENDSRIKYNPELPTVTILCGPHCSGKSTYVNYNKPLVILSRDKTLMRISRQNNYNEAWKHADQHIVDEIFEKEKELAYSLKATGFTIDMTMMSAKSRVKMTQNFKNSTNFNYKLKVFLTDYDTLLNRNSNRDGKVLQEYIIENMCKSFQMPYSKEKFYDVEYIFS